MPFGSLLSDRKGVSGVSGAAGSVVGHGVQFLVQSAVRPWVPSPVPGVQSLCKTGSAVREGLKCDVRPQEAPEMAFAH